MIKFIFSILSIMGGAYLLDGVYVQDFWTAFWVALCVAILNFFLKPLLVILTLPITILSLGLFLIVINGIVFWVAAGWVDGFGFDGFWTAVWFSIIYSLLYAALEWFTGEKDKKRA